MGNCACCADEADSHHVATKYAPVKHNQMIAFDDNTEIWMKEFTKKMVIDMLNKGIVDPTLLPTTLAINETAGSQY